MIVEVLGWKFVDEADANFYISKIDNRLGFPNGDTLHYCMWVLASYQGSAFPCLPYDSNIVEDLGQPYNFFIENGL